MTAIKQQAKCINQTVPRTGSEMRFSETQPGGVNSVCPGSHSRYATWVTLQWHGTWHQL